MCVIMLTIQLYMLVTRILIALLLDWSMMWREYETLSVNVGEAKI